MKKFLLIAIILMQTVPAFSQDDDSTPYMPYTEQPVQNVQSQKRTIKKVTTKKPAPKKTTVKKKTTTPAPKKVTPPKPSTLDTAIALMKQEKYEQAKNYLLKAIQENKNDPNVWYWYGVYHEKTGAYYQAQYFYSKAVTIDPMFEPLSRVVFYPEDSEKTALWDPKRPARVYPIETSGNGLTAVPPNVSNFPTAPNDPELPKVPVYVPPEPGAIPTDGDSWAASVYVPPASENTNNALQVYTPPQSSGMQSAGIIEIEERSVLEIPINARTNNNNNNNLVRADKPLYNPPEPGQKIANVPAKVNTATTNKPAATTKTTTTKKQPAAPRKVVKKSSTPTPAKPKQSTNTNTTARPRTVSPDVRPQNVQPVTPPPAPVQQQEQEIRKPEVRSQYLPPVGQYAPDPGTISEMPIPPVGQGNND